jgi:ubiquinone/menaquinone biosynthesis C-methylase UbiE
MPSLEENEAVWGHDYQWQSGGDEWSAMWGGPTMQWYGAIFPRIRAFLPSTRILEIAPGHGRWTAFLLDHCDDLLGVDLSENCIDVCRERFADLPKASFFVNDGTSLPMAHDNSVDFVFSFDSLVHVEIDVLQSYMDEFARILTKDGAAFFHHSNNGADTSVRAVDRYGKVVAERLPALTPVLKRAGVLDPYAWRALSVSAPLVEKLASDAGLRCVGQEVINWSGRSLTDCISLICRPGSRWDRQNVVAINPDFGSEARSLNKAQKAFGFET